MIDKDTIIKLAREAAGVPHDADIPMEPDPRTMLWLTRLAQAAYKLGLEDAANVCDTVYYQNIGPAFGEVRHGIAQCSAAIRSLKESTNG